jgi:hypothetical protein
MRALTLTPAMFVTPLLLVRGCPEDKLDEAVQWMGPNAVPYTCEEYLRQVDEAIRSVVAGIPRPTCEHVWTDWIKDGGFFSAQKYRHRTCKKCREEEREPY